MTARKITKQTMLMIYYHAFWHKEISENLNHATSQVFNKLVEVKPPK